MTRAIFLSASVPDPRRDRRYFATMDNIAIRDAVRALATVVLPHATLYWGGHPSITPLIRMVAESLDLTGATRVRLFQSEEHANEFPSDNDTFETCEIVPAGSSPEESYALLRERMLTAAAFDAAIFIGGMEGVEDEFSSFRRRHPSANVWPIASTGAAARILFDRERNRLDLPESLLTDYAYASLFRRLLELPATRGAARPTKD